MFKNAKYKKSFFNCDSYNFINSKGYLLVDPKPNISLYGIFIFNYFIRIFPHSIYFFEKTFIICKTSSTNSSFTSLSIVFLSIIILSFEYFHIKSSINSKPNRYNLS